tara:strand:- start:224 stop:985 length:762 start_codon:yes stop_codon:yes gene_type:complete
MTKDDLIKLIGKQFKDRNTRIRSIAILGLIGGLIDGAFLGFLFLASPALLYYFTKGDKEKQIKRLGKYFLVFLIPSMLGQGIGNNIFSTSSNSNNSNISNNSNTSKCNNLDLASKLECQKNQATAEMDKCEKTISEADWVNEWSYRVADGREKYNMNLYSIKNNNLTGYFCSGDKGKFLDKYETIKLGKNYTFKQKDQAFNTRTNSYYNVTNKYNIQWKVEGNEIVSYKQKIGSERITRDAVANRLINNKLMK